MNSIKACLGDKVSPKPASATKKMCHNKPREKRENFKRMWNKDSVQIEFQVKCIL